MAEARSSSSEKEEERRTILRAGQRQYRYRHRHAVAAAAAVAVLVLVLVFAVENQSQLTRCIFEHTMRQDGTTTRRKRRALWVILMKEWLVGMTKIGSYDSLVFVFIQPRKNNEMSV